MKKLVNSTRGYLATAGALVFGLLTIGVSSAQGQINGPRGGAPQAPGITDLQGVFDFLKVIVQWILAFGLLAAVAMIIWGGIKYVTAGGNSEKAGEGAKIVGYALVGVAVMVLAYALVNIVASVFGVDRQVENPFN